MKKSVYFESVLVTLCYPQVQGKVVRKIKRQVSAGNIFNRQNSGGPSTEQEDIQSRSQECSPVEADAYVQVQRENIVPSLFQKGNIKRPYIGRILFIK